MAQKNLLRFCPLQVSEKRSTLFVPAGNLVRNFRTQYAMLELPRPAVPSCHIKHEQTWSAKE